MLIALLLAAAASSVNPCGSVVPGEAPVFDALAARMSPVARASAAPMLQRLARWEQDCSDTDLRIAAQDLRRLIGRTRDVSERTELHALLAVAISRGPEVRVHDSRGGLFMLARRQSNTEREARRLFADVLKSRPDALVAREFATLGLATRDEDTLEMVDDVLQSMPSVLAADEELRAMHALVVLARRDHARAARMASALDVASVRARRIRSLVLLTTNTGASDAAAQYLNALVAAEPAELVLFYEDVWPLLTPSEQALYEALPADARAGWIREEWEWRASQASRPLHERLQVHFERSHQAIDWYRRMSFKSGRSAGASDVLIPEPSEGAPFDDRGLLYVRHGPPGDTLVATQRLAWVYPHLNSTPGAGIFEFRRNVDWMLVGPDRCAPGYKPRNVERPQTRPQRGRRPVPVLSPEANWAIELGKYDPTRAPPMLTCDMRKLGGEFAIDDYVRERRPVEAAELQRVRERTESALATEKATPDLDRLYQGLITSYAFRSASGGPELLTFLQVPLADVTPASEQDGFRYDISMLLAVEHPRARRAERRDTTVSVRVAQRPAAGQVMRFSVTAAAQPDPDGVLRLSLFNPARDGEGQVWVMKRPVPAFAFGSLSLSDIVVAEQGSGGVVARGGERFTPVAGHMLSTDARFSVFFETYGVTGETPARIRVTVAPVIEGLWARLSELVSAREALDISFDDVLEPSAGGIARQRRDLSAELEPGRYQLRVEVTTAAGSAVRTTDLVIVE